MSTNETNSAAQTFEQWKAATNRSLTMIGHTIEQCGADASVVERMWRDGTPAGYAAKNLAQIASVARASTRGVYRTAYAAQIGGAS
jgi:phosphoribosylformimino-5-aminoimidazole carboxamide ribonucleotide (ProFAR) isomerase